VASERPQGRPDVAVVGFSVRDTCGVHDNADLLTAQLSREGVRCTTHWLVRRERALGSSRTETDEWVRELTVALERERPRAILLHYSVFSYSHKGVPIFVHPLTGALRRTHIPVYGFLHEFAYPWRLSGLRGFTWALTQRAVLLELLRSCSGLIVTTDWRAEWLRSQRWLPRRPVLVAPVASALPAPDPAVRRDPGGAVIGLFGYSYQGAAVSLILDAVRDVRRAGTQARLVLLGAPGPDSAAARTWLDGARERSMPEALSFSGTLPAQDLADALAACDVLLFADSDGPSSRKSSLSGSLSSGRPVLAIDGPHTWRDLVDADALRVVAPTAGAITGALLSLLGDRGELDALGARGRAFAAGEMGVERAAAAVRELVAAES
jgi:glycosyltransferase involved in cell wall biosynthesis